MERHFDEELKDLKNEILRMGAFVEEAIFKSVEALKKLDKEEANAVIADDRLIDELELATNEKCLDLIISEHVFFILEIIQKVWFIFILHRFNMILIRS